MDRKYVSKMKTGVVCDIIMTSLQLWGTIYQLNNKDLDKRVIEHQKQTVSAVWEHQTKFNLSIHWERSKAVEQE